ncbi:MAG: hypothetical protein AABY18_05185 [Candidatus Thermoplasmatota archaeon]
MTGPFAWLRTLWAMVDERLAELAETLQSIVRMLRLTVAMLVLAVVLVLVSPVVLFLAPDYFPVAYAVSTVILVIPLVALAFLVALPLRLKSVIRLIDKGYPANAKEIAIRVAARKLHDQSIETEELLVDTALNEGRKLMERAKARAAAQAEADAADGGAPQANP